MQFGTRGFLFLAALGVVAAHPPPEGEPCLYHPDCPQFTSSTPNSTVDNNAQPSTVVTGTATTVVTSVETTIATTIATTIETRFIPIISSTTAENTIVSTVTEVSYEASPPPILKSKPYFFNPNIIYIKYCNGPAAPDNAGCTGNCTIYSKECSSTDESWGPRKILDSCQISAHRTQCVETNGKVIFRTCSIDVWGPRSDSLSHFACTSVCEFHPGVKEDGTWIYNTRWTSHIDVYPNPSGEWAKDFNGGRC